MWVLQCWQYSCGFDRVQGASLQSILCCVFVASGLQRTLSARWVYVASGFCRTRSGRLQAAREGEPMAVKVGINGFGRIGRNIMRAALGSKDIDFVAVNDLTNAATLAHLLKYDSILGNLHADIRAAGDGISVDGDEFKVLSVKDPAQLPWKALGAQGGFESTCIFTARDSAAKHLAAGAKKVIIT